MPSSANPHLGPTARLVLLVAAALPPSAAAQEPTPPPPLEGPGDAPTSDVTPLDAPAGAATPDPLAPGDPPPSDPPQTAPPSGAPPPTEGDAAIAEGDASSSQKTKKKKAEDPAAADPAAPAKKKKKKPKKPKEKHKIYRDTEYLVGVYPAGYVQPRSLSAGVRAGVRTRLEPKKNQALVFGLHYEYEPFSTKTLGFPEEDETQGTIRRTLVQPVHIIAGEVSRTIVWGKLVKSGWDLEADAWWPDIRSQRRWSVRLTPRLRIGRATGFYGELTSELYYKKFPDYYIDAVMRRIDQEGLTPTAILGYNVRKLARIAAGFQIDYTHYLDAHYNALDAAGSFVAADGSFLRSTRSKNYLDFIPFADVIVRPAKGLRLRGRYAFERQITQSYDRVMTGRDEFASLIPKYFEGYYDYRRHRANLWLSWRLRDRLELTGSAAAWVRHFDVYEARTADNFWTGQLRLDTEVEGSLGLAVRAFSITRPKVRHDFYLSLLGSHVTRRSNMKREISLATNFDISRVVLGFEVRGRR